jgi:hypothetical protein
VTPVISSLLGATPWKPTQGSGRLSRSYRPHSLQLLIARGADLTIRARVPATTNAPAEVLDVSGAEHCAIFPLR